MDVMKMPQNRREAFHLYPRHVASRIREALEDTPVVALNGPRQSGKTTLVREIAGEGTTYLTPDDITLLAAARRDPVGFVRGLDRAIIDEIQRAPDLMLAIKQMVDHIWLVSFMHYDIGFFDDETCRLEPSPNPFGAKVLTMSPE